MPKDEQTTISYAGTFERSLDVKNRVTIPAGWLSSSSDEFYSVPSHTGDYLLVMPPEEFNSIEGQIRESGRPRDEQRKAIRQFYSQAMKVSTDSNGRILLPVEQCESLNLKNGIVLVGGRSRFEIWNPQRWTAVSAEETGVYHKVAEMIGL